MPVTDFSKDLDNLTITITAEFAAPVERVWQVYADPRQLEQIWGPPTYPATVEEHSLTPGGRVTYYMTSPEGEKYRGLWRITDVDEPTSFAFDDFFADENYQPNQGMPGAKSRFSFAEHNGGTKARYVSTYASAEDLQQMLAMGMEEGAIESINQIDAFLAG